MHFLREPIDLASDQLRGYVLAANDEFFAPRENLNRAEEPLCCPDEFGRRGKRMDGWETRRRGGQEGNDWAVIRLGVPGTITELVIDTSHFTGNYPPEASVDGCVAPVNALPDSLEGWVEILPRSALRGDAKNRFPIECARRFTHLKLNIFPDGGVARFRAIGFPIPHWTAPGRPIPPWMDLASLLNGGHVHSCSDMHFGDRQNLIEPGLSARAGNGWETRRRREKGNEWAIIELLGPGRIEAVTLDTAGFQGNCPDRAMLEASTARDPEDTDWFELLPTQTMVAHTEHYFVDEVQPNDGVRWVRLNIFPDGGVARLRLWGSLTQEGVTGARLISLNASAGTELSAAFKAVCHSSKWVAEMAESGPFAGLLDLQKKGAGAWSHCREKDWKEALDGHPRIGERAAGKDLASRWSRGEQSSAAVASEQDLLATLRERQLAYEERFGFLFLICATGLTSAEILAVLEDRIQQAPERELQTVAEELAKIIHLRLEKLLTL